MDDLRKLPINAVRVLSVFIEKNEETLDSPELQEALEKRGISGKKFGATMAVFSKYKKEALLRPILNLGRGNRWLISEKYLSLIKDFIAEVIPYLDKK